MPRPTSSAADPSSSGLRSSMEDLSRLARRVLPKMWDAETGLFSHKTLVGPDGSYENRGANPLYSAISLVGLLEDRSLSDPSPQLGRTLDALHSTHAAEGGPALGGCLMWAAALAGDGRAPDVLRRAAVACDVGRASNQDLGLLLSGLVKCHEHDPRLRDQVGAAIPAIRTELLARFDRTGGLFRGARFREGRLTSFASQVYPIHGLAELARCRDESVPPECVTAADVLVSEQGPQGQWWWQYSRSSGRTVEGYPVYSVHQDGMAFMALATLQGLGHGPYAEPLNRGVRWLYGSNELDEPVVRPDPEIIFRCIQRRGSDADGISGMSRRNRARAILASVGLSRAPGVRAGRETLEILRECRSYHLGWLLYANRLVGTW